MARSICTLFLFAILCAGCGTDPADSASQSEGDASDDASSAAVTDVTDADQQDDREYGTTDVVTRADLDQYMANFEGESGWIYGERTEGELVGTWISVDGDGDRVVFGADGSFSEDFIGKMTTGLYAISDTGKIVAFSESGGVSLGSHFQLDGETITGPKGPNPSAEWRRAEVSE